MGLGVAVGVEVGEEVEDAVFCSSPPPWMGAPPLPSPHTWLQLLATSPGSLFFFSHSPFSPSSSHQEPINCCSRCSAVRLRCSWRLPPGVIVEEGVPDCVPVPVLVDVFVPERVFVTVLVSVGLGVGVLVLLEELVALALEVSEGEVLTEGVIDTEEEVEIEGSEDTVTVPLALGVVLMLGHPEADVLGVPLIVLASEDVLQPLPDADGQEVGKTVPETEEQGVVVIELEEVEKIDAEDDFERDVVSVTETPEEGECVAEREGEADG